MPEFANKTVWSLNCRIFGFNPDSEGQFAPVPVIISDTKPLLSAVTLDQPSGLLQADVSGICYLDQKTTTFRVFGVTDDGATVLSPEALCLHPGCVRNPANRSLLLENSES